MSTAPPAPRHVVIDGAPYPLVALAALGLGGLRELVQHWALVRALVPRRDLTPAEADALVAALDAILTMAVPSLPADARARLAPDQGVAVAGVFLDREVARAA